MAMSAALVASFSVNNWMTCSATSIRPAAFKRLQHQAVSLPHLGRGFYLALNHVQDALLFQLPVPVELIKSNGYVRRFGRVLLGEQLDDVLGHIHSPRRTR